MLIPPKRTLSLADLLDRTVLKMAVVGVLYSLVLSLVTSTPLWVNVTAGLICGGLAGRLLMAVLPDEIS